MDQPPVRARVDASRCCGYTTCADVCPEIFKLDDGGFAFVENEVVPRDLVAKARLAEAACPEGAITVQ